MAEIVGFNTQLAPARRETLEMVVRDLYPHGGDISQAVFWSGLRPMTPDGTPIVGRTPLKTSILIRVTAHWGGRWHAARVNYWLI